MKFLPKFLFLIYTIDTYVIYKRKRLKGNKIVDTPTES